MTEVTLGREGIARHCNIVTPDGVLFKVFKTLAGGRVSNTSNRRELLLLRLKAGGAKSYSA